MFAISHPHIAKNSALLVRAKNLNNFSNNNSHLSKMYSYCSKVIKLKASQDSKIVTTSSAIVGPWQLSHSTSRVKRCDLPDLVWPVSCSLHGGQTQGHHVSASRVLGFLGWSHKLQTACAAPPKEHRCFISLQAVASLLANTQIGGFKTMAVFPSH